MNQDQTLSLVRSLLKVGGGMLVTKGITDSSTLETIIAGLVAIAGLIWAHFAHAAPAAPVIPPPSTVAPPTK